MYKSAVCWEVCPLPECPLSCTSIGLKAALIRLVILDLRTCMDASRITRDRESACARQLDTKQLLLRNSNSLL